MNFRQMRGLIISNRNNQLLLDKLLEISKGKFAAPGMNHKQPKKKRKGPKSLNYVTKKREMERIDQENMKLMNRIVNQNAMLNTKKFEAEYKRRKRLQKSLQRNKLRPIQNMLKKKKMKNQRSLGKLPSIAGDETPQRRTHEGGTSNFQESRKRERTTDFIQRNRQEVKKTPGTDSRTPVAAKKKQVRATPGKNSKYRPILKDREQKLKANQEITSAGPKKKEADPPPYKNMPLEDQNKSQTNSRKSNRSQKSSQKEPENKVNIDTNTPKAEEKQQETPPSKPSPKIPPKKESKQEIKQEAKQEFAFEDDLEDSKEIDIKEEEKKNEQKDKEQVKEVKEQVKEVKEDKKDKDKAFEEESIDDDYEQFSDDEDPPVDEVVDDHISDDSIPDHIEKKEPEQKPKKQQSNKSKPEVPKKEPEPVKKDEGFKEVPIEDEYGDDFEF